MYDTEFYYPLLMIKDFNAKEFSTSEEFMTNADVPTYAVKDVIPNPINPFTGKLIGNDEKYAHDAVLPALKVAFSAHGEKLRPDAETSSWRSTWKARNSWPRERIM